MRGVVYLRGGESEGCSISEGGESEGCSISEGEREGCSISEGGERVRGVVYLRGERE